MFRQFFFIRSGNGPILGIYTEYLDLYPDNVLFDLSNRWALAEQHTQMVPTIIFPLKLHCEVPSNQAWHENPIIGNFPNQSSKNGGCSLVGG